MLKNKRIIFGSIVIIIILVLAVTFIRINQDKKEMGDTCIVQFETSGGSEIEFQEIEKGLKILKPENPLKEGFTFIEWQLDDETYNFENIVNNDITLTAVWKANADTEVCTVTFDSSGGSEVESIKVKKGNTLSQIANPTRDGYIFKGWYLNNEIFDFNSVINNDILLTAKWEESNNFESYNQKSDNVITNSTTPATPTTSITQNTPIESTETDKTQTGNNNETGENVEQVENKNEDISNDSKEKVYPTSIIFSNDDVALHYDETTTIYYTLTSWRNDCEVINDKLTFMDGSTTWNVGKHIFEIEEGKITVRTSKDNGSYTQSSEIYIYGSQDKDCYIGKFRYTFIEYPIEFLTLSTENVTLKAPVLTEDGRIPYDPYKKISETVELEYGFPNAQHEGWSVWSSDENIAIVTDIEGLANRFRIVAYRPGNAIVTVRVVNATNAIEKKIYVTITE